MSVSGHATPQSLTPYIKNTLRSATVTQEMRVEINAHQKAYALDEELNQWLTNRGIQFRSHFTGKNKWDVDFGVASMAALFGSERDGKALRAINLADTVAEPVIRTRANMKVGFTPNYPLTV